MDVWGWVSIIAFITGIAWLAVSGFLGFRILSALMPLLTETRSQVQDLGDLAASTVGRAAETVELVELRVSQTMGQATQGSVSVTKQALGLGSIIAGFYMASRFAGLLREQWRGGRKRGRRR
jgi:hypothetical protein